MPLASWFGKLLDMPPFVFLKNVKFKVSEAGRQRVIKEKKKNVHAFVEGEQCKDTMQACELLNVFYNPYKYSSFVDENKDPLHFASFALINGNKQGYSILINK